MVSFAGLIELMRTLDALLMLEKKHGASIKTLQDQFDDLAGRVTRLETREEIIIEKAKAAAAASASAVTMYSVADMARRIGFLEARSELPTRPQLEGGRTPR